MGDSAAQSTATAPSPPPPPPLRSPPRPVDDAVAATLAEAATPSAAPQLSPAAAAAQPDTPASSREAAPASQMSADAPTVAAAGSVFDEVSSTTGSSVEAASVQPATPASRSPAPISPAAQPTIAAALAAPVPSPPRVSSVPVISPSRTAAPDDVPRYSERDLQRLRIEIQQRALAEAGVLSAEVDTLQRRLDAEIAGSRQLAGVMHQFEIALERALAEVEQQRQRADAAQEQAQKADADRIAAEDAFNKLHARYEELKRAHEARKRNELSLTEQMEALRGDLARAEAVLRDRDALVARARTEGIERAASLQQQLDSARATIAQLQGQVSRQDTELRAAVPRVGELELQLARERSRAESQQVQLIGLEKRLTELVPLRAENEALRLQLEAKERENRELGEIAQSLLRTLEQQQRPPPS